MKTIFITAFHSFISRSILNTDAFKILAEKPDLKIVIFTPDFKRDFYVNAYGKKNIIIEGVNIEKISSSRVPYHFQKLAEMFLPTYTKKMWAAGGAPNNKKIKKNLVFYWLELLIFFISENFKISHKILRAADLRFSSDNVFGDYIEKYRPDLCFATDLISGSDVMFLMAAKKAGTKTIGMVRSWDCATNKSLTRILPDKIIAINEQVKNEMIKYHDVEAEDIFISGFPQFDSYLEVQPLSREEFFKLIGADTNKRLLFFAPAGKFLSDYDAETAEVLKKALRNGKLPADVQFLVSYHPQNPADLSNLKNDPNFIIRHLGTAFGNNVKANELDKESANQLINFIYHSEIIIHHSSSLGLDASIFDKPQIMIAFDGYQKKPYLKSMRRYHDENNMKGFINTGAARVVNNPEELVYWINKYLKNPKLDAEGRERARKEILMYTDGKSGERIAKFVLRFLD